jgi:glycosyltransferase involved in cell wall biosynthesis
MSYFRQLIDMPAFVKHRWLHSSSIFLEFTAAHVENCFQNAAIAEPYLFQNQRKKHPLSCSASNKCKCLHPHQTLVSYVTTSFKSKARKWRPYLSLLRQTSADWEWLVICDVPSSLLVAKETPLKENNCIAKSVNLLFQHRQWQKEQSNVELQKLEMEQEWQEWQEISKSDCRVHVFQASKHSGYIGQMKQWVTGLASGDWIVELDHDDEVSPDLTIWVQTVARQYPDAGFMYTDFAEVYEGTEASFSYGDDFAWGYGSYNSRLIKGKLQNHNHTNPINLQTWQNLTGLPNHARIWSRQFLQTVLGGFQYNRWLPVADDFELLVRTIIGSSEAGRRIVRIADVGYLQYRNIGADNYTDHRRKLIQDLQQNVRNVHYDTVATKCMPDMVDLRYDECSEFSQRFWRRQKNKYLPYRLETVWRPGQNTTISIVLSLEFCGSGVDNLIKQLQSDPYVDWELIIIGVKKEHESFLVDSINEQRVRYWQLPSDLYPQSGIDYAIRMLVQTRWTLILFDSKLPTIGLSGVIKNKAALITMQDQYVVLQDLRTSLCHFKRGPNFTDHHWKADLEKYASGQFYRPLNTCLYLDPRQTRASRYNNAPWLFLLAFCLVLFSLL